MEFVLENESFRDLMGLIGVGSSPVVMLRGYFLNSLNRDERSIRFDAYVVVTNVIFHHNAPDARSEADAGVREAAEGRAALDTGGRRYRRCPDWPVDWVVFTAFGSLRFVSFCLSGLAVAVAIEVFVGPLVAQRPSGLPLSTNGTKAIL
jgi:hypothetical protein